MHSISLALIQSVLLFAKCSSSTGLTQISQMMMEILHYIMQLIMAVSIRSNFCLNSMPILAWKTMKERHLYIPLNLCYIAKRRERVEAVALIKKQIALEAAK